MEQLLGVTIDQPLEKFGNPLYAVGTQGFDNVELRQELMEVIQKSVLALMVQMAENQSQPDKIPQLSQISQIPTKTPSDEIPKTQPSASGRLRIIP